MLQANYNIVDNTDIKVEVYFQFFSNCVHAGRKGGTGESGCNCFSLPPLSSSMS